MEQVQNKAIVVGGASGIGLSLSLHLISLGFHVIIVDKKEPQNSFLNSEQYTYLYCDLRMYQNELFESLAKDSTVQILLITAGVGRVAPFETFNTTEIYHMITINLTSITQILQTFYCRIHNKNNFYCSIISSISGLLSSPLAAVYSASKAGLCRLIESINIELEVHNYKNRILNVAPASIKGTSFLGGETELSLLTDFTCEIVKNMFDRKEMFIPFYEQIFKQILKNYNNDPHSYGLYSYQYKLKSNRISIKPRLKIGYLSGTFDLFHIGHLNLLQKAKQNCDYLIVGIHESGKWKGKPTFIPFEERMEIVKNCKYVDKVVRSCIEDSDAWLLYKYNILFVGSDYKGSERFNRYEKFFKDKEVEIVYFPYTKSTSSTQIRNLIIEKGQESNNK